MTRATKVGTKPSPTGLSHQEIIRVARELIAEQGVDGLTMRRLSDRLGVALGATYHYVPTRHDLLVRIGEELYAQIQLAGPEVGDWAARLKAMMISAADVVGAYPGMANYLLTHIDTVQPADLNRFTVAMLTEAGFDDRTMAALMSALTLYVAGMSAAGLARQPPPTLDWADPGTRAATDFQQLFEDGLDLLLDGARLRLDGAGSRRRRR